MLVLGALLGGSPQSATAQVFPWAQGQSFAYQFNPDMVRTNSAPCPDGCVWWSAPVQHRYNYGQDELASVRLTRLTPAGTVTAQRLVEGNLVIDHLLATPDGGVCLTGGFRDSLSFGGGHRLTPTGSNLTHFLARLDSAGQVAWVRPLRVPNVTGVQAADAIALDPRTGDVWVATDIYSDSYVTRYNAAGDSLTSYVQQDVNRVTSVAVAPDGTLYTAGSCAGAGATYNGLAAPVHLTYSDYVACYDPRGRCQWVRYIESITCDKAFVSTADSGGVYLAGSLFGVRQIGTFTVGRAGGLFGDYYLTRLDRATGTFQWAQSLPSGNGTLAPLGALTTDLLGRAWLLATVLGPTVTWPNGLSVTPPAGGGMLLSCYDSTGTMLFVLGNGGMHARALSINLTPTSLFGTVSGVAPRGNVQLGMAGLPAIGQDSVLPFVADFFLLFPLSSAAAAPAAAPQLAPNPVGAGGRVVLVAAPRDSQPVRWYDCTGRLVATAAPTADGYLQAPARPGLYVARRGGWSRRVVVE